MNKIFLLAVSMSSFFSCIQEGSDAESTSSGPLELSCYGMVDVKKWQKEILYIDSVLIDGYLPVQTNKASILKKFGLPNRTIQVAERFDFMPCAAKNTQFIRLFYGRTIFDLIESHAIVRAIDFSSTDIKLIHKGTVLSKGTNIRNIVNVFPESCKLIVMSGNAWSGYIELKASDKSLDPRRWILIFQNEELVKIMLCQFGPS